MYRLGMQPLIDRPGLHNSVSLCAELGLSFVELNMNMAWCCPENLEPSTLRDVAEQSGIGFTLHLPEELDLASLHPQIRAGHLNRCLQAIEWAGQAGISLANMHLNSGVYFTLPDRKVYVYEQHAGDFMRSLMESFGAVYDAAARNGVTVCIENCGNFARAFIASALQALSGFEGFALTWDVGHDASAGYSDREALMHYGPRVRHMHLHDCNGRSSHQPLMTGEVDVLAALEFARARDIGVVIEVKTPEALTESVNRVRPYL